MIKKDLVIKNKLGIHARPAALLVQTANNFSSSITIEKDGQKVNGKSIMGIMMLAAEHGSTLVLTVDGSDEEKAISAIEKLFEDKFEEE
jgi:phosphocarrier protein HPr